MCSGIQTSVAWSLQGAAYSMAMPPGIRSSQVRETLAAMVGLDGSVGSPKEAELVIEVGDTSRMRWLLSLSESGTRITLKRMS